MNFLSTHDCRVDYREFRTARSDAPRARRSILTLLPPLDESKPVADAGGSPGLSGRDQTNIPA
jgi:hypothetical protein